MRKLLLTAAFVLALTFTAFATDGNMENPGVTGNMENPGVAVTIIQAIAPLLH